MIKIGNTIILTKREAELDLSREIWNKSDNIISITRSINGYANIVKTLKYVSSASNIQLKNQTP